MTEETRQKAIAGLDHFGNSIAEQKAQFHALLFKDLDKIINKIAPQLITTKCELMDFYILHCQNNQ